MANCYELARELGNEILSSEEYLRLKLAAAVFEGSEEARGKLDAYYELRSKQESRENGELEEMARDLMNDPVIGPFTLAQNDFNALVNTVTDILRATITGKMPEGCGNACETCGGCEG